MTEEKEGYAKEGAFVDAGIEGVVLSGETVSVFLKSGNSVDIICSDSDHANYRFQEIRQIMDLGSGAKNVSELDSWETYEKAVADAEAKEKEKETT